MFQNYFKGKRVWISGHTGFKGSWLSQWLLDLGADVAGFSIGVPTKPALFEVLKLEKHIRHEWGDIRDYDLVKASIDSFKPEIILHLAAQPIVRESYINPKLTFDTNVGGTVNVLEAVRHQSSVQSALVITTDKVYENREWDFSYRENDPLGGKDPYSASKAAAEIAISSYARSFFGGGKEGNHACVTSARAGNVIGGGDWCQDRIVPDCVRAWHEGESVELRNAKSVRPWQHVLEPLSGYLWLLVKMAERSSGLNGEPFNFGPTLACNQPVESLVKEMSKHWTGARFHTNTQTNSPMKEAGKLYLANDKAAQQLDWSSALSFEKSVSLTAEWYRDFYAGSGSMENITLKQIHSYQEAARAGGKSWC